MKKQCIYVYQTPICNYCQREINECQMIFMHLSKKFCSETCRRDYHKYIKNLVDND